MAFWTHLDQLVAVPNRVVLELDRVAVVVKLEGQLRHVERETPTLKAFRSARFRQGVHQQNIFAHLLASKVFGSPGGQTQGRHTCTIGMRGVVRS